MKRTLHAALVIARRQVFETVLSPGLYVTVSVGLFIGYFFVSAFTKSIDSAGFNAALHPLYDLVNRLFVGLFGTAFASALFAEGPFLLALNVSFVPVLLFLSINSVFRFGLEKGAGAIELLTYGPANGTSYMLASFLKDVLFSAAALVVFALFFAVGALMGNLVLGPSFFVSLVVLFFISLSVFAYGAFLSVIASSAATALAAFAGIMVIFAAMLVGSLSLAGDSVRTIVSVMSAILQWLSPFFYASLTFRAAETASAAGFVLGLGLTVVLTAALLAAGHGLLRRKGVRS
jgi:hypothetical protein